MNYRTLSLSVLCSFLVLGAACADRDIGLTSTSSAGDEIGDTETADTDADTDTGTNSADTDVDEGSSDDGSSDDGSSDDESTGDTGGNICEPDLQDVPCAVCVKDACCAEVEACEFDVPCTCAYDCILDGNNPLTCQSDCAANTPVSQALLLCGQSNCLGQCLG